MVENLYCVYLQVIIFWIGMVPLSSPEVLHVALPHPLHLLRYCFRFETVQCQSRKSSQ